MKNLLLVAVSLIILLVPSIAFSVGDVLNTVCKPADNSPYLIECTADLVGDAVDGSFPPVTFSGVGGSLTGFYIDEGTTATDGTITIAVKKTGTDVNLLGPTAGTDVSTSAGYATVKPLTTSDQESYLADFGSGLTVEITGGTTPSANPKIFVTVRK